MLRLKFTGVLMAAVMVAALSGISATAASAATELFTKTTEKCTGGTFINLCYENAAKEKLELSGKQTVTVTSTTAAVFKVPTLEIEVKCAKVTQGVGTNVITQTSPLKEKGTITGTLIFKECKVEGALGKKCTVPTEKETLGLTGKLETESELKLSPASGTVFIELPFSNNGTETCPATVKGTHKITGFQAVTILEPGVAQETKKGSSVAKSGLKFSEEAAELTGTLELAFTELGAKVYVSKEA